MAANSPVNNLDMMGFLPVVLGVLMLVGFLYAAVLSKALLPPSDGNRLLPAIQNDRYYYCLLIPLTLPVVIVTVYLHWLSMKMFKHA